MVMRTSHEFSIGSEPGVWGSSRQRWCDRVLSTVKIIKNLLIILFLGSSTPSLAWALPPICLTVADRPSAGMVVLAWEYQPVGIGALPVAFRVERLNQTTGKWVEVVRVPVPVRWDGTGLASSSFEALVPLAPSGRRLYRVCSVTPGHADACSKEGGWAQR